MSLDLGLKVSQAAPLTKNKEIPEWLDYLRIAVDRLSVSAEKLYPVIKVETATPVNSNNATLCPLATELRGLFERIEIVTELINRVEL